MEFIDRHKNFLVKFCSITLSLVIVFVLTLNLPIIAYSDKQSGKITNLSIINFIKAWQPLVEVEGEIDKPIVADLVPTMSGEKKFDDGLDLKQVIEGQYTVLFMGFDEGDALSDVNWIFQFDIAKATLNVLQIPRDTFMPDYTGSSTAKFNSIYSLGNSDVAPIQRVVNAVQDNFGIPIDAYLTMYCNDIANIVDLVGGIPMTLDERMVYEGDKIIPAGDIVLNGRQSEWFVRYRRTLNEGDIGRIKNQRKFLAAAMAKMLNIVEEDGKLKLFNYLKEIYDKEWVATNISVGEISMLSDFGSTLAMENVHVHLLPGEGGNYYPPGHSVYQSIWSIHKDAAIEIINSNFRPYQLPLDPGSSTIVELVTDYKNTTNDDASDTLQDIHKGTGSVKSPNY